jgi:hypothetical protein
VIESVRNTHPARTGSRRAIATFRLAKGCSLERFIAINADDAEADTLPSRNELVLAASPHLTVV